MDLRELGRVGLKLFGVWTALTSIAWLLGLLQLLEEPPRDHVNPVWSVLVLVLPALVYGLFTWLFLARTEWLLTRLLSEARATPPALPPERVQSLVPGGVRIAQSHASLAGVLVVGLAMPTGEYGLRDLMRQNYQSLVYSLVWLAIGTYPFSRRPGPRHALASCSPRGGLRARTPGLGASGRLIPRTDRACLDVA